ncbi:MAG: hypothetical protein PHH58_11340 [Rhodoferax sp.]|nr:hypothetical protein [Rhodoferax sp.]
MYQPIAPRHVWRTAAHSDTSAFFRADLAALGHHLNTCPQIHRHLLTLQHASVSLHGFVATRLVTTLVVVATLLGLVYWAL